MLLCSQNSQTDNSLLVSSLSSERQPGRGGVCAQARSKPTHVHTRCPAHRDLHNYGLVGHRVTPHLQGTCTPAGWLKRMLCCSQRHPQSRGLPHLLMVWHRPHIADVAKALRKLGRDGTTKQVHSLPRCVHRRRCHSHVFMLLQAAAAEQPALFVKGQVGINADSLHQLQRPVVCRSCSFSTRDHDLTFHRFSQLNLCERQGSFRIVLRYSSDWHWQCEAVNRPVTQQNIQDQRLGSGNCALDQRILTAAQQVCCRTRAACAPHPA